MLRAIVWLMCMYLALMLFSGCAETGTTIDTNKAKQLTGEGLQTGALKINASTYYAAARLHERQGNLQEAIHQYTLAIEKDPTFVLAYSRLGIVHNRRFAYVRAEECLKKALKIAPNDASLHNNLAFTYLLQKRYRDAEAELRQAISLAPESKQAKLNLGIALAKQGRFDQGLQCFRQVCPPHEASYRIALLHQAAGQADAAERHYRQTLAQNPQFTPAQEALARLAGGARPR